MKFVLCWVCNCNCLYILDRVPVHYSALYLVKENLIAKWADLCIKAAITNKWKITSRLLYAVMWCHVEKVKCTLVQALRLCTGRTAYRGSRGIALLFHDHGTRRGWSVSVKSRPLFTLGKDPVPIVQEAGWAPGSVWTGAGKTRPHRDSIPGPSSP